jgi:hypothetical protein
MVPPENGPSEPPGRIVGNVGTDAIAPRERNAEPMKALQKTTDRPVRSALHARNVPPKRTADLVKIAARETTVARAKNERPAKTVGNVGTATIADRATIADLGRNALRAKSVLRVKNANALTSRPISPPKVCLSKCPKDLDSCARRTTTT